MACCKEPESGLLHIRVSFWSTGVGDVFSTGGTKDEVVPAPRLPKEGVLMSDAL